MSSIAALSAILAVTMVVSSAAEGPFEQDSISDSPAAQASIDRPDHPLAREMARNAAQNSDAPLGSMRDMLQAQNTYRTNAGLPPLVWSPPLAEQSHNLIERIIGRTCSAWAADALTSEEGASYYWAPAVRGIGGSASPQDLSARFVASEWEEGVDDYSAADGICMRDTRTCGAYAAMMSPVSSRLGCDFTICSTSSQVWVCKHAGGTESSEQPAPG